MFDIHPFRKLFYLSNILCALKQRMRSASATAITSSVHMLSLQMCDVRKCIRTKLVDRLAHLAHKTSIMLFLTIFAAVVLPDKLFLRWHLSLSICAFIQATNWQIDSFVRHYFTQFSPFSNKSRAPAAS